MKTFAVYNNKGGVGKTTATVNLGFAAARSGLRVVIWDLDSQAAATYYFRIKPKLRGGSTELMRKTRRLTDFVKATNYSDLDLIPAEFSNRYLDRILDNKNRSMHRLALVSRSLAEEYDLLLLDCAPSFSTLAENIFNAADALVIPLIPTTLSVRAYRQLENYIGKRTEPGPVLMPFFSMVDRRKKMHGEVVREFYKTNPEVMRTFIGYLSDVEKMGAHRAPVQAFARGSRAAGAFNLLWDEITGRLNDKDQKN